MLYARSILHEIRSINTYPGMLYFLEVARLSIPLINLDSITITKDGNYTNHWRFNNSSIMAHCIHII